jgi:hypothetical protein
VRTRLVIPVALLAVLAPLVAGAGRAWATDGDGQNNFANAQASGGQLTVQAGHTYWTPPSDSSWATATKSDPPRGKPNPNQPYGCTYQADPQAQQTLGAGGPTPGEWVIPTCAGPGVIDPMPPLWVTGAQPPALAVAQIDPVVVARQAVKQLGFASPTIQMAPPSGSPQLVGVATWLWIAPGAWQTLTASATAGPVTATATAIPSKVVWVMGDGDTVTCDGPAPPTAPRHRAPRPTARTPGPKPART